MSEVRQAGMTRPQHHGSQLPAAAAPHRRRPLATGGNRSRRSPPLARPRHAHANTKRILIHVSCNGR
ncbi:hypothetical protein RR46_15065 [Papilio xuthus]|uniref:Uncharacterized protein n=1 Tax=Papilio xuthus TaxID=66420 RepID=A0A194PDZ7_PAPXU|nr:hypothetical protein RR46_15065 [Papilio xuthus]